MWPRVKLKYVTRFGYGDALPSDESQDGAFRVFGSNGPFASFYRGRTPERQRSLLGEKAPMARSIGQRNHALLPTPPSSLTIRLA